MRVRLAHENLVLVKNRGFSAGLKGLSFSGDRFGDFLIEILRELHFANKLHKAAQRDPVETPARAAAVTFLQD